MTDLERWQESNSRQLGAALAELRQRLERCVQQQTGAPAALSSPEVPAGVDAS
jgi:hypothetical protein